MTILIDRTMTKVKSILIATILFTIGASRAYAQGCSDAGFCTINSFKPNNSDSTEEFKNQFKFGAFYGLADYSISVYGNYFEYNRILNKKFGLDAKLTTLAQTGNGISVFGLSDFYVNANYTATESLKFTLGAKIPLSKADKTFENLPLPMDYQASLGTFDLIIGAGYEIKKIQVVLALQQPLTQNDNQFIASDYPLDSKLRTFQSTHNFVRSGDVLLRVSYPFKINSKLKLTPSILPIYHLTTDKFTDEFNVKREISGSHGLTLNGNVYLDYQINNKNILQLNAGIPFVVRESRPDGLTRALIVNLEYKRKF